MPELASAAEILPGAREFLREHLDGAKAKKPARRYRFEHCLRVASIGRQVAKAEGMDADLLELGCLLHDVGKYDAEKPVDHGRAGALTVLDFLRDAGLPEVQAVELAQGIAMHTDGLCNARGDEQGTRHDRFGRQYLTFDSEPTLLARSIGDCDNIDRFSAYRIYDTLRHFDFLSMASEEQAAWIESYRGQLERELDYECATEAAQEMWVDALDFQQEFFTRLGADVSRAL